MIRYLNYITLETFSDRAPGGVRSLLAGMRVGCRSSVLTSVQMYLNPNISQTIRHSDLILHVHPYNQHVKQNMSFIILHRTNVLK